MRHLGLVALLGSLVASGPAPPVVRPGLEVLLSDSLALVRNRRVGLVANQGSIDSRGVSAVDRLLGAGVNLVAIFSPEHGFRGVVDPGVQVPSATDSATGLPIYSLYGPSHGPSDSSLARVDVILVDLPDVGARYFSYLGTTLAVMKAAARAGKPVVVLDRPDPIGGRLVQGNVLDSAWRSMVGSLTVPMRPGLTLGELARLGNDELSIGADLVVVPAAGWHRDQDLAAAGLPFVHPSPNLLDLEALYHYPGSCLFEGTALSVGRGTDAPFRQIGAPWLNPDRVIRRLRSERLPGIRFESVRFTPHQPGDGKLADTTARGIRLVLTDRASYDPTATAVALLVAIRSLYPDRIDFRPAQFDRLAGGPALREAIERGEPAPRIVSGWAAALRAFGVRRDRYLLYR